MHNKATTDRMIKSFLARKAEEFPEVFNEDIPDPIRRVRTNLQPITTVTR